MKTEFAKLRKIVVVLGLAVTGVAMAGAAPEGMSAEAGTRYDGVLATYQMLKADIVNDYQNSMATLNAEYGHALSNGLQRARSEGKMTLVAALHNEIDRLDMGNPTSVPSEFAELKRLQETYNKRAAANRDLQLERDLITMQKFAQAMHKLQGDLSAKGWFDDAILVLDAMEKIEEAIESAEQNIIHRDRHNSLASR